MPPAARTTLRFSGGWSWPAHPPDGIPCAPSVAARLRRLVWRPCQQERKTRSDIEVEWQLDALDLRPVERWLAIRTELAPIAEATIPGLGIVPGAPKRLVDVYIDTEDWRIGRAGYVLRVRRRAGRVEATLKDLVRARRRDCVAGSR